MSFEKCIQPCNTHPFKIVLYAPSSQSSTPSASRYYFYHHRCVLPTLELHNNGIRWSVLSCVPFLFLTKMVFSDISAFLLLHVSTVCPFYCWVVLYFINMPQFIHSSVDGYLLLVISRFSLLQIKLLRKFLFKVFSVLVFISFG